MKEVVKHSDVKTIWNVDIDGKWLHLNRENPELRAHLRGALDDPRVQTVIADPIIWLRHQTQAFDVILVEDPEPRRFPLARGFSLSFFRDLKRRLAPGGTVTLSLGSFDEPDYWCVARTAREAGLIVNPSHSLDLNGYEGTLILSHDGLDFDTYDERVPQFSFVKPGLLLAASALQYYQQDEVVVARSQPFPLHTFQRPACLPYLLPSH